MCGENGAWPLESGVCGMTDSRIENSPPLGQTGYPPVAHSVCAKGGVKRSRFLSMEGNGLRFFFGWFLGVPFLQNA